MKSAKVRSSLRPLAMLLGAAAAGLLAPPAQAGEPAGSLRAGAAKVDIAPSKLPPRSQGVLDPLNARAIVLDNGHDKAALVSVDAGALSTATWQRLSARAKRELGIPPEHFMLTATHTHSAPFVLLLLINYFSTLPRELDEQARVDGCTRLGALWRIVLPLSVPGLVAGGLLAFIMTWNNFLFAFLFTTTNSVKTLPVMMRLFAMGEPAVWGTSAAGAVLTTLPVALIFLLFQRMLMSGLAAGAVKG